MSNKDAFIENALKVDGMLRKMGEVEGTFACYDHFIGALRRFTMIPLDVAVADETTARQTELARHTQAAGEYLE
ncbi:MAG TPA: hypothetical protein VKM55_13610 [Candidatus Lokiarchaeia archaeon]|nr:hypothetical protein [Candidatus Lokiarchaeia archaeon]